MFRRIRVQLTVGITGLLLLLSGLLSLYFFQTSLDTLTRLDRSMLERVGSSLRTLHELSRNTGQSLFLNHEVVAFSSSDRDNVLDIARLVNRTQDYGIINPFLRSVYVYNGRQDILVTVPEGSFESAGGFFDQEVVRMLRAFPETPMPRLRPVARNIDRNSSGNPVDLDVLTYCLYSPTSDGRRIDSAVFLNIDADVLGSLVSAGDAGSGATSASSSRETAAHPVDAADNQVLVIDEDGVVLSHPERGRFSENWSDKPWVARILSSGDASGSFTERVDGRRTVLTWMTVKPQNWRLISLTPFSTAFSSIVRLMVLVLVVSLLILMVGILYAVFASRRIYRPIGNLIRMVKAETEDDDAGQPPNPADEESDEVATLTHAYRKLSRKSASARNRERAEEALRYLRGHLDGNPVLEPERLGEVLGRLHCDLDPLQPVQPAVLRINRLERFRRENSGPDRAAMVFGACNILSESLSPHYRCLSVDVEPELVVLLLQTQEEPGSSPPEALRGGLGSGGVSEEPARLLADAMRQVGRHLGFTFSISLGRITDWSVLPEALQETMMLSQFRLRYGGERVLTTDLLPAGEPAVFTLPAAAERQLLDAIRNLDGEKAKDAFDEWRTLVADAPTETIMTSAIHLVYAVFTLLGESTGHADGRVSGLMVAMLERTSRFETMEEIEEAFHGLMADAISLVADAKAKRPDRIVSKVDEIIEQAFSDRSLCLNLLADRIGLSPLYLGRLYKGATGRSVAESLMKRRLDQVKLLLDTTVLPVPDILDRSGLEKSNYFYTLFRKHFGVSLGEYRRRE